MRRKRASNLGPDAVKFSNLLHGRVRDRTSANNVWVDFLSPTLQIFTFTYSLPQISQNLACIKCCCMILLISKTLKCPVKPTRLTKHSFLYRFKMYICPCYNHWMNAVRCMGVIKYIYIYYFFSREQQQQKRQESKELLTQTKLTSWRLNSYLLASTVSKSKIYFISDVSFIYNISVLMTHVILIYNCFL